MKLRILTQLSAFALICALPLAANATDEGGAGSTSGSAVESSNYEVESSSPASTVTTDGDAGGAGTTSGSTDASSGGVFPGDASVTGAESATSDPAQSEGQNQSENQNLNDASDASNAATGSGVVTDPAVSEGQAQSEQGGAGTSSGLSGVESGELSESATPTPATQIGEPHNDETGIPGGIGGHETTTGSDAGGAGATTGSVSANQVTGTVDSVDTTRRRLTVRDDQGNLVSYDLSAGADVKVGDRDSALSALSNGDAVTITLSEDDPTSATEVRVDAAQ